MSIKHGPARQAVRRRLRRRRLMTVLFLLMAVLLLLAGFAFFQSDVFLVKQVQISGLHQLKVEEVRQASGLDQQILIWRVRPQQIEKDLISRLPRIYSVQVSRHLPNRVSIRLVERVDAALMPYGNGDLVLLDRDGVAVEILDGYPDDPLPLVSGLKWNGRLRMGARPPVPKLGQIMSLINAFGEQAVTMVSEVNVSDEGGLVVYLTDGTPVYFGQDGQWAVKVQALQGILSDLRARRQRAGYIDLRSAYRPVVKEK